MPGKARKGFGKGPSEGKIRILPVQEAPPGGKTRGKGGQCESGQDASTDQPDFDDLLDGMDHSKPLAQRMAQCLRDRPEQVKRLFTSWVEQEED
jgi:hypothetical protein